MTLPTPPPSSGVIPLDRWRLDLSELARVAAQLAAGQAQPSADDVERLAALARGARATTAREWEWLGVEDIFAPLPPVPWLVQHVDLCPGAPMLVAGYGYAGKSVACQALALSVATGRPVWGSWAVARTGGVRHLDYEQGRRLTCDRYQRLAYGMGIDYRSELAGRLSFSPLPKHRLDDDGAADLLSRAGEGHALVVIDSLRAVAGQLEENSSEIRRVLDAATTASERTGACFVYIHHARKPAKDAPGGSKMSIRGSGAIFDACASVLVFSGEKGEPTDVSHEKARTSGVTADDFALVVTDVDDRRGLRVVASGPTAAERQQAARVEAQREQRVAVLEFIRANPGCSQRAIRAAEVVPVQRIQVALGALEGEGLIRSERRPARGGGDAWFAT